MKAKTLLPHVERLGSYVLILFLVMMMAGSDWDIEWHFYVGRDSFWIAPHLMMYSAVAISGILAGLVMLLTMIGTKREKRQMCLFGLRAPVGYAIVGLGALTMISAAPFDDLWHRLYGIDITIWSPPHLFGVIGAEIIAIGTVFVFMQLKKSLSLWFYWTGITIAFATAARIIVFGNFPAGLFTFFNSTHAYEVTYLMTRNPFSVGVVFSLTMTWLLITIKQSVDARWYPALVSIVLFLYSIVTAVFSNVVTAPLANYYGYNYGELFDVSVHPSMNFLQLAALSILPAFVLSMLPPLRTKLQAIHAALLCNMIFLLEAGVLVTLQDRFDTAYVFSSLIQVVVYAVITGLIGMWLADRIRTYRNA